MARTGFGKTTETAEVLEGIDLTGRVAVVTGSSGGLGAETARALAEVGASVTLACRDVPKGEGVAASIRESTGAQVDVREIELSSPQSVRRFAEGYLQGHPELHILINNAGVMARPLARTPEGWELQFATNHIGHFLLTCLLVPALRKGAPSRVVCLTSGAHRMSPVVFDDIHFENREYDKFGAYAQSKTADVLFACELNRRLSGQGITANAVHPGVIVTDLGRHMSEDDIKSFTDDRRSAVPLEFKNFSQGSATSVWAATAPELEGQGGLYLEDCHIADVAVGESVDGYAAYARDPEAASRLWAVTEETLGEKFELA